MNLSKSILQLAPGHYLPLFAKASLERYSKDPGSSPDRDACFSQKSFTFQTTKFSKLVVEKLEENAKFQLNV